MNAEYLKNIIRLNITPHEPFDEDRRVERILEAIKQSIKDIKPERINAKPPVNGEILFPHGYNQAIDQLEKNEAKFFNF